MVGKKGRNIGGESQLGHTGLPPKIPVILVVFAYYPVVGAEHKCVLFPQAHNWNFDVHNIQKFNPALSNFSSGGA